MSAACRREEVDQGINSDMNIRASSHNNASSSSLNMISLKHCPILKHYPSKLRLEK